VEFKIFPLSRRMYLAALEVVSGLQRPHVCSRLRQLACFSERLHSSQCEFLRWLSAFRFLSSAGISERHRIAAYAVLGTIGKKELVVLASCSAPLACDTHCELNCKMVEEEEGSVSREGTGNSLLVSIAGILITFGAGIGLTFLGGGRDDPFVDGLTILQMVAVVSYGINTLAFVPAYIFQTEKYYDLTGSLTYLTTTTYSLVAGLESSNSNVQARPLLASCLVYIWAIRLGTFLFARIRRDGKDGRFDSIKPDFFRFLMTWEIQSLWVFLTAFCVYIVNSSSEQVGLDALDYVGLVVWVIGFSIEAIADRQKSVWRSNPENKGRFIEYGLWYYSRHPNYFGEFTLWTGQFLIGASVFEGKQWVAVISPIFVYCLLNFLSGVPLLEKKMRKKWGGQPDFENYIDTTSVFFILPKLGKRVHQ